MFNVVGWVLRRRSEGWHRLANMGIVEQAAMILVLAKNTSFDSGNRAFTSWWKLLCEIGDDYLHLLPYWREWRVISDLV
jgi:hypothetical protein